MEILDFVNLQAILATKRVDNKISKLTRILASLVTVLRGCGNSFICALSFTVTVRLLAVTYLILMMKTYEAYVLSKGLTHRPFIFI